MRPTIVHRVLLLAAFTAALTAGCAKKPPAVVTPPPAPAPVTTPTPTPTPPPPAPTPAPPASSISVADLHTVYFALDSDALDDAAKAVLDQDAKALRENASLMINVDGHCDERGTEEYNQSLGERRATHVVEYLTNAGIAGSRLTARSFGKLQPAVDGHDESAWAKNRRVEFK